MRPIDADELRDKWKEARGGDEEFIDTIRGYIDQTPTLDVVPVVRCKDCWRRDTAHCPVEDQYELLDNSYCYKGERYCKRENRPKGYEKE